MRISEVESLLLKIPYRNPHETGGFDVKKSWEILLVKVVTSSGLTGWGEAFGLNLAEATKQVIDLYLAPRCIGENPLQREQLLQGLAYRLHNAGRNGPAIYALSGLEIALWDIAAKDEGVPLNRLLGQETRSQVPAYASLMPLDEVDAVRIGTESALKEGYESVKIHEKTVETVRACRQASGQTSSIMVDTNCIWAPDQALEMAKRLREFDLLWLEEPVWPPENFSAIAQVRQKGGVPIASGENIATRQGFLDLLECKAVDYVQPSPAKCGGISGLLEVMDMANTHQTKVAPHSIYIGPGFLATLHAIASAREHMLAERLYCELKADIYRGAVDAKDGYITVPHGPGLGLEPDPLVMDLYRVA